MDNITNKYFQDRSLQWIKNNILSFFHEKTVQKLLKMVLNIKDKNKMEIEEEKEEY